VYYRGGPFRHLEVPIKGAHEKYRAPNSGSNSDRPARDRIEHAANLTRQFDDAVASATEWLKDRQWIGLAMGEDGFYLEISTSAFDPEVFASKREGIEVVAVVLDPEREGFQLVTVYVPKSAKGFFREKLEEYRTEETETQAPAQADRVERIDGFRFRDPVELLWTDPGNPPERGRLAWWEVWVRDEFDHEFRAVSRQLALTRRDYYLPFPERRVYLVQATREQLETLVLNTGSVGELRAAKDRPSAVLGLDNLGQTAVATALADRVRPPLPGAPTVCVLDRGVNHGHPLLEILTDDGAMRAFVQDWGTHDGAPNGHGTQVAGLALYGNLTDLLAGAEPIEVTHRLESVKIVPDDVSTAPPIELYGEVVRASIFDIEIERPNQPRVFCTATTNDTPCANGTPTQWSAAIDAACADKDQRRLFITSAGNISSYGTIHADDYDQRNEREPLLDPAQAWNAISVGAYTDLCDIHDPNFTGHRALAPRGGLCPQSRTSVEWNRQWPIKPDVVMEGGNFAVADGSPTATVVDDLMLLSTNADFAARAFAPFGFTSGAASLAAHACGTIWSHYPQFWPETVRGMLIHSADWTPEMLDCYGPSEPERMRLVNRYGYGLPDIQRGIRSLQNDVTLVIQSELQPFLSDGTNNEMVFFALPWGRNVLLEHANEPAKLRVTLSYFVEPNPAERGWKGRYRFRSHGLRFAVKDPEETVRRFRRRINRLERDDDFKPGGGDEGWFLKQNVRNRGSVISDVWEGTAGDLARRGALIVYPVQGWWTSLLERRRAERRARFSLIVSLYVANPAIDIYTPIATEIQNLIDTGATEIPIGLDEA
jgi:hypothetical protein